MKKVFLTLISVAAAAGVLNAAQKKSKSANVQKKSAATAAAPAAAAAPVKDFMTGWKDAWSDGTMTEGAASVKDGALVVSGISFVKPYGCIYKKINVDLDAAPYLVVDVTTAQGFWYLVASNPNLKDGFVRIQADVNTTGKNIYNLKTITGLTGKRDLEIQIGVSSGKSEPNLGKLVAIKDFRLAATAEGSVEGTYGTGPWRDSWADGTPTGASVKSAGGTITITGNSKYKPFGTAYRILSVNLDKTPVLKITPKATDAFWFVEAVGGSLKAPVKLQPDTQALETMSYDLKTLLNLTGIVTFELHLGVGTGGQDPNAGKMVSFDGDAKLVAETPSAPSTAPTTPQ